MANEIAVAENYVYDKLSSLLSGRVYRAVAPATATYPLIVFGVQSPGADVIVVGGNRVWATPLIRVVAIGKTRSLQSLASTADAIDTALHNTSGGDVVWCIRESPFTQDLIEDGVHYTYLGGFYRVRVIGG